MIRRIGVILLAPALGVLLALAAAPPSAQAAPAPIVDPSTIAGVSWSTGLANCGGVTRTDFGGWTKRSFVSYRDGDTADPEGDIPAVSFLGEICKYSATETGLSIASQHPVPIPDGARIARTRYNSSVDGDGDLYSAVVHCRNSAGAVISRTTFGVQRNTPTDAVLGTATSVLPLYPVPTGCDKLLSVQMTAFTRAPTSGAARYEVIQWNADRYLADEEYVGDFDEADPICDLYPDWLLCEVLRPPNPISWDSTCGDTNNAVVYGVEYAAFNPVDPGTWGPAVAWLGACLFIPLPEVGGFDRNGDLADAWANSPNSEAGNELVGLADAFTYAPSCGPIITFPDRLGAQPLNTCAWTWAEPVRSVLAIGVVLFAVFAFLNFIVKTSWSIMRNPPNSPLEEYSK